jgi:uncharacterized protein YprB with RNaseH-like and TPR domain
VKTIRADSFKSWKKEKSNNREVVQAIIDELEKYDIVVAHNGEWYDKKYLNAMCLKYGIRPVLRFKKSIDPILSTRKYLQLGRNSLTSLIDFLDIPDKKTPIDFQHWIRASHDSNTKSMDYIVAHCVQDVKSLTKVYDKMRVLIDKIDNKGSAY